ncbi:glycosyltransferase involved in cell wall biosynthesis/UDP:flavonoid glycosyltransferase YjiC (YdhE family) [Actinoplanes tereljensis]|uniref:Antifreeze protein, type I n=1 Tax=Paractinoplanes tereljensis TaxID=571912 RepID=A0A919NI75_9ACTN|nr:glycosyltransferase [Actinoplanes tereljensis]GIF18585.1 antifreeze protein, type I [Actinoplanes tereljensis]
MPETVYDVAILSDFRYPGGTSASIAAEVQAQAEAALSTVLVHVPSPHQPRALPFSPRISELLRDGVATLARDDEPVRCKLLLVRQPRIFTADLATLPRITAERTVMVINQAPGDVGNPFRYYDFAAVRDRVHRYFGDDVEWAPISSQVRDQVRQVVPDARLAPADWHEIIDVAHWWRDRDGFVGEVPVIGRHGRGDPVKWPLDPEEIRQAYPEGDDTRVRILGGGEIAVQRLGTKPENWDVIRFGAEEPEEFLRTIDVFVYFHDPDLVEAFGRTILEAMASGVPVIIGEHFRPTFDDAALYGTPADVRRLVTELYRNPARYREVVSRAREFAEHRYGHQSHLARLADFGIRSRLAPTKTVKAGQKAETKRVLMVSDNGAGMGHLSRLMAIARRLPDEVDTVIATQSYAASVAHQEGFLTEYIPSRKVLDAAKPRWTAILRARLEHLIELHEPSVVAVDCLPHPGIVETVREHPELTWVWVRRAMWQRGVGADWITEGKVFDHVLEPGEFAAIADEGPTVADRARAFQVEPISFLDESELLDRDAAKSELDLDDRPAVLLQLGAGNINDISSPIARICRHLTGHGFQLVLAESTIATRPMPKVPGAKVVRLYPVSRYLRAFDLAISATGYNSFHEQIAFAIPTVFLPNTSTRLDDQVGRARFAAATGVALVVEDPASGELEQVLDQAVRPEVRAGLAHRCRELSFGNGGAAAAKWLSELPSNTWRMA